jgi:hypothetical protein
MLSFLRIIPEERGWQSLAAESVENEERLV